MSAKCKSCGAEIIWKLSGVSGKAMPISVASKERRIVISNDSEYAEFVDTYASHFADCPNAAQHRKPK